MRHIVMALGATSTDRNTGINITHAPNTIHNIFSSQSRSRWICDWIANLFVQNLRTPGVSVTPLLTQPKRGARTNREHRQEFSISHPRRSLLSKTFHSAHAYVIQNLQITRQDEHFSLHPVHRRGMFSSATEK